MTWMARSSEVIWSLLNILTWVAVYKTTRFRPFRYER